MDRPNDSSARLHILVVDDDVGCLASLEEVLLQDGHDVSTATRGEEALAKARQLSREKRRPELSILDYHVPDLSGLETFSRLTDELPQIGAIFISGDASDDLETKVLSAGGFAFVRKPLDAVRVREVVQSFCALWLVRLGKERLGKERLGEERFGEGRT